MDDKLLHDLIEVLPKPPHPWGWRKNENPSITEQPKGWTLANVTLADQSGPCRGFNISVLGQSPEPRILAMSCLLQVQRMMEDRRDLEREERNALNKMITDWLAENIHEKVADIRVGAKPPLGRAEQARRSWINDKLLHEATLKRARKEMASVPLGLCRDYDEYIYADPEVEMTPDSAEFAARVLCEEVKWRAVELFVRYLEAEDLGTYGFADLVCSLRNATWMWLLPGDMWDVPFRLLDDESDVGKFLYARMLDDDGNLCVDEFGLLEDIRDMLVHLEPLADDPKWGIGAKLGIAQLKFYEAIIPKGIDAAVREYLKTMEGWLDNVVHAKDSKDESNHPPTPQGDLG